MYRNLVVFLACCLLFSNTAVFGADDSEGHTLAAMWRTYYVAEKSDRPHDALAVLEKIKSEAFSRHLPWDYYDACAKYAGTRISISWKDRDSAKSQKSAELADFGEPVISVFLSTRPEEIRSLISQNEQRLKSSNNPEFYKRDASLKYKIYADALIPLLNNDYEYALWAEYARGGSPEALRLTEVYPFNAFLDYDAFPSDTARRRTSLKAYIDKYSGAAALLAQQELLRMDYMSLDPADDSEKEFLDIKERCLNLLKLAKGYSGNESLIAGSCRLPQSVLDEMGEKSLDFDISESVLTARFRNIHKSEVRIFSDGKELFCCPIETRDPHFCVWDTLTLNLPHLPDGCYSASCSAGDNTFREKPYNLHTLSIITRYAGNELSVFVSDYKTGEPVEKCRVGLYSDKGLVCEDEELKISGFTKLSSKMQGAIASLEDSERNRHFLVASMGIRKSTDTYLSFINRNECESVKDRVGCKILSDRTAFNPGDTVRFKLIPFERSASVHLLPEGSRIKVVLFGPDNSALGEEILALNDFGSASGVFEFRKGWKGGNYRIEVSYDGEIVGGTSYRVDEFVLPTHKVVWDHQDRIYFEGDTVVFSGKVKSFSGHPLSALDAKYSLSDGIRRKNGNLNLSQDGSFELKTATDSVRNKGWAYITMSVTIADATGTAVESSSGVSVQPGLHLDVDAVNPTEGSVAFSGDELKNVNMIVPDEADFKMKIEGDWSGTGNPDVIMSWRLSGSDGKTILEGTPGDGGRIHIDMKGRPSGIYHMTSAAGTVCDDGRELADTCRLDFLHVSDFDSEIDLPVKFFLERCGGSDSPSVRIGATSEPIWALVELNGDGRRLLGSKMVRIGGGKTCKLTTVAFERRPDWPKDVRLSTMFFKDYRVYRSDFSYDDGKDNFHLPLSFTRFHDRALPGSNCTFSADTEPGVECAVSVSDLASEAFNRNEWTSFNPSAHYPEYPAYVCHEGDNSSGSRFMMVKGMSANMFESDAVVMEEEAIPFRLSPDYVRDNFLTTLAWEPFLRSTADGCLEFKVRTSDKLSTYSVQLFAHNKSLHNSVLSREMLVTIPVQVALSQPRFIYESDSYSPLVSLSSLCREDVGGTVSAEFFSGGDRRHSPLIKKISECVVIPASGALSWKCDAPSLSGIDTLGILLRFTPDSSSAAADALFVAVPVLKPYQTITEAHSAVLTSDLDRQAVENELRSRFANTDPSTAEVSEISILALLGEALPDAVVPKSDNSISLSQALCAASLLRGLGREVPGMEDCAAKLRQCFNSDGGIAWFKGMGSSPLVTALVLERVASMRGSCDIIDSESIAGAVRYLDERQFASVSHNSLGLVQYLRVRALFADVPFEMPASQAAGFRKEAILLLTGRLPSGDIMFKARRILTLRKLTENEDGLKLAASWGLRSVRRMNKVMEADKESLTQYAVMHEGGGCYFPNAVMPWRGLLDSELRAHCLLCEVFEGEDIAEGIRLWMMLQKETQKWDADAAYIEALASVFRASEKTLGTRVLSIKASADLPFSSVIASGNGMNVSCSYFRNGRELHDGDTLHVGDVVSVRCRAWSAENRSFVRVCVPRTAAFRPVNQLSGSSGWPWGIYRWVLEDRTEYWYELFPEETSEFSEEYFVEQEGRFCAAAPGIESLYAPHYRANSTAPSEVCVLSK